MEADTRLIRDPVSDVDIRLRGEGISRARAREIKKGLITLHTLETMAVIIYRFQITNERSEHNRQLIKAMCNEMTHLQDFQVKLYEYGWRPSIFRWAYAIVGFIFAFSSRIRGRKAILKTGIWVETKAVRHYGELLETIGWDDETRCVIEKDRIDEEGHIARWKELLEEC